MQLVCEIAQAHRAYDIQSYLFEDINMCATHVKCITIMPKDIHFAC